jgi:hypothetical protein
MLNSQLTEMENRHEFVKNNFVENLSHTEFVGNEYFEQLVNDESDKQFFNNLIRRQLLDVRSSTNENFPGEEPDEEEEDAKIARAKSDATIRANNYDEINAIEDTEQVRSCEREERSDEVTKKSLRIFCFISSRSAANTPATCV